MALRAELARRDKRDADAIAAQSETAQRERHHIDEMTVASRANRNAIIAGLYASQTQIFRASAGGSMAVSGAISL